MNYLIFQADTKNLIQTLSNCGGGKRIRTADPLHAMQVLYQLSYTPEERTHCIEHLSKNQGFYDFFSF